MQGGTYAVLATACATLAFATAASAQETAVEAFDFGGFRNVLCDEIAFMTAGAVGLPDIHWQDRPTFQQIVEVQGHRSR